MKILIAAVLFLNGIAVHATCQSIYNPMTQQWEYVCTPEPSDPQPPQCQQQFDPMNQVWVTVCN